ncbi:MAG TPA: hypothetical protein VLG11_04695 [Candidatus Saccharimonadales bacterium]|nr:hypothetical protein [Candidatus Saccharimonadales bacterium]
MIFELFRWWYGAGWRKALRAITAAPAAVERNFSVIILLETLFSPWKRMTSVKGRSLDAQMQAMLDNLVSRLVGFFVRLFVLFAAGLSMLVTAVFSIAVAVVWPAVPLLIIACVYKGITG